PQFECGLPPLPRGPLADRPAEHRKEHAREGQTDPQFLTIAPPAGSNKCYLPGCRRASGESSARRRLATGGKPGLHVGDADPAMRADSIGGEPAILHRAPDEPDPSVELAREVRGARRANPPEPPVPRPAGGRPAPRRGGPG